jgi:hypothetical protein
MLVVVHPREVVRSIDSNQSPRGSTHYVEYKGGGRMDECGLGQNEPGSCDCYKPNNGWCRDYEIKDSPFIEA